jgi:ribosomal protein L16/L10AE
LYKKRLNNDYINKGLAPDFTKKGNAKLRDHWDSFVQYNLTLETTKMIAKNTINASKKEFHKLGSGGYKVVMPK